MYLRDDRHDPSAPIREGFRAAPGEVGSATFGSFWLSYILFTQLGQSSGKLGCLRKKRGSASLCFMVVTGIMLADVCLSLSLDFTSETHSLMQWVCRLHPFCS